MACGKCAEARSCFGGEWLKDGEDFRSGHDGDGGRIWDRGEGSEVKGKEDSGVLLGGADEDPATTGECKALDGHRLHREPFFGGWFVRGDLGFFVECHLVFLHCD